MSSNNEKHYLLAVCFIMACVSVINAQTKHSAHPDKQDAGQLYDAENVEKDSPRLHTIEGKVKPPSPKVIYLNDLDF